MGWLAVSWHYVSSLYHLETQLVYSIKLHCERNLYEQLVTFIQTRLLLFFYSWICFGYGFDYVGSSAI